MKRKIILLFIPVVQIVSTAFVFRFTSLKLGQDWAILAGFIFSQVVWCIVFPLLLIGKSAFINLFKEKESLFKKKNILFTSLLVATIVGAAAIYLVPNIQNYSLIVFILGVPITVINSVCEEILWRGAFIEVFKNRVIFSVIYPSMFFALYHIAPQLADPEVTIINTWPMVLMVLPLGFIYGIVAFRNKSIKWTAIAHSLSGIIAFGVPLSTSLANIFQITY